MFHFRKNKYVIATVFSVLLMIVIVTVCFIQVRYMFEELGRTRNNIVVKYMLSICIFVAALSLHYMVNYIHALYGTL